MKGKSSKKKGGIAKVTSKELYHHGVKGQRWEVRRYQNRDGTRIKNLFDMLRPA